MAKTGHLLLKSAINSKLVRCQKVKAEVGSIHIIIITQLLQFRECFACGNFICPLLYG